MSILLNNVTGQNSNFITNGKLLKDKLIEMIDCSDKMYMYVAYATEGGVNQLINMLNNRNSKKENFECNLYVGFDQGITTRNAIQLLINFQNNTNQYVNLKLYYILLDVTFHSKVIQFEKGKEFSTIVGSANLTSGGFLNNVETGLLIENNKNLYDDVNNYFGTFKPKLLDQQQLDLLFDNNILPDRNLFSKISRNKSIDKNKFLTSKTKSNNSRNVGLQICYINPNNLNHIDTSVVELDSGIKFLWIDAMPGTGDNCLQLQIINKKNISTDFFGNPLANSQIGLKIRLNNSMFDVSWQTINGTSMRLSSSDRNFNNILNTGRAHGYNLLVFAKDETNPNTYDLFCVHESSYQILKDNSKLFKEGSKPNSTAKPKCGSRSRQRCVGIINC
jgi:HKD family nuclease